MRGSEGSLDKFCDLGRASLIFFRSVSWGRTFAMPWVFFNKRMSALLLLFGEENARCAERRKSFPGRFNLKLSYFFMTRMLGTWLEGYFMVPQSLRLAYFGMPFRNTTEGTKGNKCFALIYKLWAKRQTMWIDFQYGINVNKFWKLIWRHLAEKNKENRKAFKRSNDLTLHYHQTWAWLTACDY